MLRELKQKVWQANQDLVSRGLVFATWGNASAIDRSAGLVVIKPSGVAYETLRPDEMAVVACDGTTQKRSLRPSSDTPTHLELYRAFPEVSGIVHTHSHFATVWAQACRAIPCLGTTHGDYCPGKIPVTDILSADEVAGDYEANTGRLIARRFDSLDPMAFPGVLVAQHGPFAWGTTVELAVESATMLEEIARMAFHTVVLAHDAPLLPGYLLDKHFSRKHGPDAYYGQK